MSYVRYHTYNHHEQYIRYVIKTDSNGMIYTVNPYCYEWIKKIGKLELLNEIDCIVLQQSQYTFEEMPDYHPVHPLEWMFQFPFLGQDVRFLMYISLVFEEYMNNLDIPLSNRCEELIDDYGFFIPRELFGRVLLHIENHTKSDPDRIRFMFSKKIQEHIKGEKIS